MVILGSVNNTRFISYTRKLRIFIDDREDETTISEVIHSMYLSHDIKMCFDKITKYLAF